MAKPFLVVGLMSGTSMDSIDAVRVAFDAKGAFLGIEAHASHGYAPELRQALLTLAFSRDSLVSLADMVALDQAVAEAFAEAALLVLSPEVCVIGSHGQTVFHNPKTSSLQLGNPSLIAVKTGVPVAADFRRADMALGGQGAPLVPAFHRAVFSGQQLILNLGGIANVTVLDEVVQGWDTGPANALLDEWCQQHTGQPLDQDGAWAAEGRVQPDLLAVLLAHPYFSIASPKSTGRDTFNSAWLQQCGVAACAPVDVQATLLELTVQSALAGLPAWPLRVCGGGALNGHLMQRLQAVHPAPVTSTAEVGLHPMHVEAAAFAWLGLRRWQNQSGNLPSVTGAARATVLGGLYSP
jgi:anhydro-N-acetylmuramic acid kinase